MGVNGGAGSSVATRTICDGDTAVFNITGDGWNGGGAIASNRSYEWIKGGGRLAPVSYTHLTLPTKVTV